MILLINYDILIVIFFDTRNASGIKIKRQKTNWNF